MDLTKEEMGDFNLKVSCFAVGRLYPILLDKHGNLIDGQHRLALDPTWPKLRLDHIGSEKERLLVRLISNVCRRAVSAAEKRDLVKRLAETYLQEGEEKKNLAHRIAKETGMTYRWVMKYLPEHMKTRPGLGGPSPSVWVDNSEEKLDISKVERRSTIEFNGLLSNSQEKVVVVRTFTNADFVNVIFEKRFYQ